MTIEQLYETLKKIQEPKGYFFNKDQGKTFELLKGLLINKDRYGYMSCPCRLASGNYVKDRISSVRVFTGPDVRSWLLLNLYVSAEEQDKIPHAYVPERRPPEKMPY
jgi:ferredoxin-thioredoxin reductase catalytic subunit